MFIISTHSIQPHQRSIGIERLGETYLHSHPLWKFHLSIVDRDDGVTGQFMQLPIRALAGRGRVPHALAAAAAEEHGAGGGRCAGAVGAGVGYVCYSVWGGRRLSGSVYKKSGGGGGGWHGCGDVRS
jgi:hypothetical protein